MTGALLKEVGTSLAVSKATESASKPAGNGPATQQPAGAKKPASDSSSGGLIGSVTKVAPSPAKVKEKFKPGGSLGGNKVLVAEFIACMVLVGVGPILGQTNDAVSWLKKGAAVTGLFLVLSLVASGGPRASKISAAFGGLVTLALLINSRDVLNGLIALLGGGGGGDGGDIESDDLGAAGEAVGE